MLQYLKLTQYCQSTIYQIHTHTQRHTALMVLTLNPCLVKDSPDPGVIRGPSSSSASSSDWSSSFFFFFFVGSLGFFNRESSSGCLMSVTIKKKTLFYWDNGKFKHITHGKSMNPFQKKKLNSLLCMFVFCQILMPCKTLEYDTFKNNIPKHT